ncbi:MAG: hypothetical protein J0M37_10325 [Ignavibacteria bacterium]|nr:hypothetical protein [Ignavibacteria bacterium]
MIKNAVVLSVIVFIVILSFSGCVTSKIEYVESSKVPVEKTYRISQIYLNDGTIIDVKEKEAKLRPKYKGVSNVIVYYEDVNIERSVPLQNVASLKIEVIESNVLLTVAVIAGSLAVAYLLAIWIAIASGGYTMH